MGFFFFKSKFNIIIQSLYSTSLIISITYGYKNILRDRFAYVFRNKLEGTNSNVLELTLIFRDAGS